MTPRWSPDRPDMAWISVSLGTSIYSTYSLDVDNRAAVMSMLLRRLQHLHLRQVRGGTQVGEEDGIMPGDRRHTLPRLLLLHRRLLLQIHRLQVMPMTNTTVGILYKNLFTLCLPACAAEHDHWIFRFPVEDKRGIVVTIINGPDGAGDRYDEGALDGARGAIISLQDPGKLDRAFVYMKLVESGSLLNVPVKYVAQTMPEKKGDRVVLLENLSGWKAGTVCTASGPPSGGMVTLTSEQGQLQVSSYSVCLHQSL